MNPQIPLTWDQPEPFALVPLTSQDGDRLTAEQQQQEADRKASDEKQLKFKHATVVRDGFTVPLIGIPPESVLEECDCCHDAVGISNAQLVGTQMLCPKCRKE